MKRLEAWLGSWHRENAALEAAAAAREKAPKGQAASTFHKAALLSGDPALHASAHHGAVGRVRTLTTAPIHFHRWRGTRLSANWKRARRQLHVWYVMRMMSPDEADEP